MNLLRINHASLPRLNTKHLEAHKLDENKNPVPVEMMEWATDQSNLNNRIVKQDKLTNDILVSTVFLGLNHQYGEGPPILFETMIFGGQHDSVSETLQYLG